GNCQTRRGPLAGQVVRMPRSVDLLSPVGPRKRGQSLPRASANGAARLPSGVAAASCARQLIACIAISKQAQTAQRIRILPRLSLAGARLPASELDYYTGSRLAASCPSGNSISVDLMLVVNSRIRIPHSEFQLTFVRSSGPGGQNVNKVNSKAVLRWPVRESA